MVSIQRHLHHRDDAVRERDGRPGRARLRRPAVPPCRTAPHHLHHPLARRRDGRTPGTRFDRLEWPAGRPFADGHAPCTTRSGPPTTASSSGAGDGRLGYTAASSRARPPNAGSPRASSPTCETCCRRRATSRSSRDGADRWSAPSTASPDRRPRQAPQRPLRPPDPRNGVLDLQPHRPRSLASLALGLDDDTRSRRWSLEPPTYLPPEPLRSAGARAVAQCDRALRGDGGRGSQARPGPAVAEAPA